MSLKVIILTSSTTGTSAYFVPKIFQESSVEIVSVIVSQNKIAKKKNSIQKRLKKVFKIGVLGAINGIRMRSWFSEKRDSFLPKSDNLIDFCNKNGINIHFTPTINCQQTIDFFNKAQADLAISVGNSYIGKKVFSIPKFGMINTHGEILPEYQNGQSVIWQLYNKSNITGYTIHKVNSKIDQGEIIYQEKFDINFKENLAQTVAYNCAEITKKAASGMVKVLENFEYYYKNAIPQGKGGHFTTPSIWQFFKIWRNYKTLSKTN